MILINVLHLDDDPFELERVQRELGSGGAAPYLLCVRSVQDPGGFALALADAAPDIILLDLHLGRAGDGLDLVPEARRLAPSAQVLVLSGADESVAIAHAMSAAVDDFVSKDATPDELRRVVVDTYEHARRHLGPEPAPALGDPQVAGKTLRAVQRRIPALVASAVTCIHVSGESGTGKEVVASLLKAAVHPRPFLSVNCGAIAPSLLESSLFGVARGSFTGATADRKGFLEAASGGWLFLDETQCLSPPAQAALLRAIENQEIFRVGDSRSISVEVRVISAANEDLRELVAEGRFRLDLWQRLSEVELALPALRDRPDEIPELIEHLLTRLPGGAYRISSAARKLLSRLAWQEGNVRQLRNCLRAMTERHVSGLLTPQAIPPHYRQAGGIAPDSGAAAADLAQTAPGGPAASGEVGIFVPFPAAGAGCFAYDRLASQLFVVMVQTLGRLHGPLSMRSLADRLGLSKSSVSRKLWEAVDLGLTSQTELAGAVRLTVRPLPLAPAAGSRCMAKAATPA